jgi:uncharacterized protein YkwD
MFSPRRFLILAAAVIALVALPAAADAATKASSSESALLSAINGVRAAHGLRPLTFDSTLTLAARAHTREMSSNGVFAHGAFTTRMHQFHVRGPFVGENLAWGSGSYGTPQGIIRGWLASPLHRANLLRPGFSRIGLGELRTVFQGARGATVVTADFAGR